MKTSAVNIDQVGIRPILRNPNQTKAVLEDLSQTPPSVPSRNEYRTFYGKSFGAEVIVHPEHSSIKLWLDKTKGAESSFRDLLAKTVAGNGARVEKGTGKENKL